mmetsp:Transcript_74017/g.130773  ORF Transcript_74017/g.130773 Transcript_74017/m.130773 type:complete len:237 (-) Transcript_74017:249-959(-)
MSSLLRYKIGIAVPASLRELIPILLFPEPIQFRSRLHGWLLNEAHSHSQVTVWIHVALFGIKPDGLASGLPAMFADLRPGAKSRLGHHVVLHYIRLGNVPRILGLMSFLCRIGLIPEESFSLHHHLCLGRVVGHLATVVVRRINIVDFGLVVSGENLASDLLHYIEPRRPRLFKTKGEFIQPAILQFPDHLLSLTGIEAMVFLFGKVLRNKVVCGAHSTISVNVIGQVRDFLCTTC